MVVGPGLGGLLAGAFTIAVPFFVCGALALVSTLLVAFTVRETVATANSPDISQTGLDSSPKTDSGTLVSRNLIEGIRQLTPHPRSFFGLCVARFIIPFSNSLIQPVLSVYANEKLGISEVGVGILFTVMAMMTLFTTLPMGTVSDEVGRKPTLILGKIFDATSSLLVIYSGSFWPLFFVMSLRGFGRAASNPSITAMFSDLVSASKRGRGMGLFNSFQNVGLVVGATVGGFLYEFSSSETPFVACAIVSLIGVAIVLLTISEREQKGRSNSSV